MKRTSNRWLLMVGTALLMSTEVRADFDVSWLTVDGGGGMNGSAGEFELSGTIGQPDAGVMAGGDFELVSGFWALAALTTSEPCEGAIDPLDSGKARSRESRIVGLSGEISHV